MTFLGAEDHRRGLKITPGPLEVLPASSNGTGWGRPRRVVMRMDGKLIFWRPGHPTWSGTGQPWIYAPAVTVMIDTADVYESHRYLMRGGRLTSKSIALHATDIDHYFGCEGVGALLSMYFHSGIFKGITHKIERTTT